MKNNQSKEHFRESISTVDEEGKRVWVYPKKPFGQLFNWRVIVAFLLVVFLVGAPFVKVNGLPLILLNVIERKFVLFGSIFWPQDFFLFAIGFIISVIFLGVFTVVYGRIWCGWLCPQTIFMEFIFRRVEYIIEGDYSAQKKLDRMDWNFEKVWKKTSKHIVFFSIAFLTANLLLAYIIGVDELYQIITDPPSEHLGGLLTLMVFSGVFYYIFAFFREQVCTIACPYGRLQGVLLNKESVVVAYDHERGEPRGKLRKNVEARSEGDCIDCFQCVHVCPTGIDIRNGTQLECINCTACIDACDDIMERIGKPKKLIGFYSEDNIEKREKFKITPTAWLYSVVLVVLAGIMVALLVTRKSFDVTVLRSKGKSYEVAANGDLINVFEVRVINKSVEEIPLEPRLEGKLGSVEVVGKSIVVPKEGQTSTLILVQIPPSELDGIKSEIHLGFYNKNGEKVMDEVSEFLGPFSLAK